MYCSKCGKLNDDNANFCANCGNMLKNNLDSSNQNIIINRYEIVEKKKRSGMAVAGMILGIISLPYYIIFVFGLLSFVFSIVGFNATVDNEKKGRNQAIAGLVMSIVSLFLFFITFILPTFY